VNSENQEYIVNYLNAGGAIYIESPDIGKSYDGTDMFSMLGAEYLADGGSNEVTSLTGQAGTITEDLTFTYNGGSDSHYSLDHLGITSGTLLFESSDDIDRVIASDYRGYRIIISSTIFGAYTNGTGVNTKNFLMEQYLAYLDVDYVSDGAVCGTVLDNNSLEPIEGATVSVDDFTVITDENGYYSISMPEGIYQLTCQKENYQDFTYSQDVIIIPCETTEINFNMTPMVEAGEDQIPLATTLIGNHPNPFNPDTNISYAIKEAGKVKIEVYNIKGQLVKTLVNVIKEAGNSMVTWSGKDNNNKPVSSGMYFYKMRSGNYTSSKKMIILK